MRSQELSGWPARLPSPAPAGRQVPPLGAGVVEDGLPLGGHHEHAGHPLTLERVDYVGASNAAVGWITMVAPISRNGPTLPRAAMWNSGDETRLTSDSVSNSRHPADQGQRLRLQIEVRQHRALRTAGGAGRVHDGGGRVFRHVRDRDVGIAACAQLVSRDLLLRTLRHRPREPARCPLDRVEDGLLSESSTTTTVASLSATMNRTSPRLSRKFTGTAIAPRRFAASITSRNSGRLVSSTATRSPRPTPRSVRAPASRSTQSSRSRRVVVSPWNRNAARSGREWAWRARWLFQCARRVARGASVRWACGLLSLDRPSPVDTTRATVDGR